MNKTTKNNSKDRGRGWKRGDLLQVMCVFEVFVRGCGVLRGILKELIHRNRGLNEQFCVVFGDYLIYFVVGCDDY